MCQVRWKFGKIPRDCQSDVIIPIFKKGDRKQCTNFRGISLFSLPEKVYAKCREIVEPKLKYGQCSFCPGRSTTDQIFTMKQTFVKSWECGKDLFACFVGLEKAYDRVPWNELRRFCKSMALMVSCCTPLSTTDRGLCSGKSQAMKAGPCGRWNPTRVRFVTSPFHCLRELDQQMQPS